MPIYNTTVNKKNSNIALNEGKTVGASILSFFLAREITNLLEQENEQQSRSVQLSNLVSLKEEKSR